MTKITTYTVYNSDESDCIFGRGLSAVEAMHEVLGYDVASYRHEVTGSAKQGWTLHAMSKHVGVGMYEVGTSFAETEDEAIKEIALEVLARTSGKIVAEPDEAFNKWNAELAAELEASEEE